MSSGRSGAPARTPGQAMSRAPAAKSRAEKTRSVTVAPLPQASVDIIPGRLSEDDWLSMVAAEDGEESVGEILDTLMGRVMEECYRTYLERQRIPYTVSQARDTMIRMVEWAFIPRDEGDDEAHPETPQQQEPQPCPNDSWAQGCVPVTQPALTPRSARSARSQVSSEHAMTDIPEQEAEADPQEERVPNSPIEDRPSSPQNPTSESREEAQNETPAVKSHQPIIQPTPPPKPPKTRTQYRPYRGPLRSAGLRNMTKSLEETEREMFLEEFMKERSETSPEENLDLLPTSLHNILKIQLGRPPQKKDVVYDEAGNVLSVPKLDLSRLPQHRVRPRIEVVNSNREAQCPMKRSGHLEVRAPLKPLQNERRIRKKEQPGQTRVSQQLLVSSGSDLHTPRLAVYTLSNSTTPDHSRGLGPNTGGILLDSMELAHGVILRGANSTRPDHSQGPGPNTGGILLDSMELAHGVILRGGHLTVRGSGHSPCPREGEWGQESRPLQPITASVPRPSLSVEQLIKNNIPTVQPLVTFMPS